MFFKFCKSLCFILLMLMLISCSVHEKLERKQTAKLGEMSRDDFMDALRWKQFKVAASLIEPEHRQDFMQTFAALKDIHVVDVRLVNLQTSMEDRRFETTVEMDYYLVPSVTVKTFSFNQTWIYFDGDDPTHQGFLVTTPFPDFP